MNVHNSRGILTIIFVFVLFIGISAASVVGQGNGNLRLVDEFDPRQGCETMEMRLDLLFADASNDPSSTAYVVIHQGDSAFDNAVVHRKAVNYPHFRRFPPDRYSVILTRASKDIRVELWLGKNGTQPDVVPSYPAVKLSDAASRIQVDEDSFELVKIDGRYTYIPTGNPSCLYLFNPYIISELLKVNIEFEVELSIKTKSSSRYKTLVQNLKADFQEVGASPEQIRFVYGGRDKDLEGGRSKVASVTTTFVRKSRK
ncbi:MAG: hypothetical protein ABIR33_17230 [Pyrinomonadaceae bacterium]